MFARFLALLLIVTPAAARENTPAETMAWVAPTVSIEVREPDGTAKKTTGIRWALDMSVLRAMQMVDGLKFTAEWYRSSNDWLVVSIDGVANEGANKRNWTFCVNGTPSAIGVGSAVLPPEAAVVWVYDAAYPPNCH